jgi:uncharacterized membrane protein
MSNEVINLISLFLAGLLAGEEFVVYYGIRPAIASLDERPQILSRQALIHRLRVLVPCMFIPTVLSGTIMTILDGFGPGFLFRCVGLIGLLTWTMATVPGTVPINSAIADWISTEPPKNWREMVSRWERFAVVRCWAAIAVFVLFLVAAST